ncbi:hypothetical protein LGQ02_07905 [Bacillus shivajii]|uniref:hypothetical protein n=1 Tax=Bacillus shivajii TaxID=1983719 RepID=UPI001CFB824C|nr:hypothetical protein [Bacillus shivajii]UCZ54660.1 hypothetical protein LGQ02_07905 [Bacillus shivajii]
MIVKDLVETRELLGEEVGEGVTVIYERFENVDCNCDGVNLEQFECDPEEIVQILKGDVSSFESLKSVKTFTVGNAFTTVDEVVEHIRTNHADLLNRKELVAAG